MGRLEGAAVLVTGAARGTGEAIARLVAAEGAHVVLGDVLDADGERVAAEIGDAASYVHLDVTSEDDWGRAVDAVLGRHGRLDGLVNNAAVLLMAAIEDTTPEEFQRVVNVNQMGPFLGIRAALPTMRDAGRGSIVNISSIDGLTAKNGLVAYASSKWGVRGITRVAALELGRHGVRVNAVCPEAGSTSMIAPYVPAGIDLEKAVSHSQPNLATQKKRSSGEKILDVAKLVVFLLSDDSASCTGADFTIDGGNLAGTVVRGMPGA